MIDFRLPNITGKTPEEQIEQLKNYLYSLVQELNWALNTLETGKDGNNNGNV